MNPANYLLLSALLFTVGAVGVLVAAVAIALVARAPALGRDTAVASTLFYREGAPGKVGRQMQTWIRCPEGWRIVAAHVSIIDEPKVLET